MAQSRPVVRQFDALGRVGYRGRRSVWPPGTIALGGAVKLSIGNQLVPVPRALVLYLTRREADRWARIRARLTPLQRKLHAMIVRDLPGAGAALTAATVAERAEETLDDVEQALAPLHSALGFIATSLLSPTCHPPPWIQNMTGRLPSAALSDV